jgi:UDP-N-acetylmuramoylalanine--D-glutamate ligase
VNRDAVRALAGRDVHVVGLASTEGAAMTRFLWAEGVRRLTVHDFQPADKVEVAFRRMHVGMARAERARVWAELAALPIEPRFGERYLEGIESADAVFVAQAWYLYPPNLPRLTDLRDHGVPFHGLTQLYFDLWPAPIVAVTGSNGKSTTSRLIESILRQTGREIHYAGNERRSVQVLDALDTAAPDGWLVLEVSNRQLIDVAPRPRIGVITNVLPNHLDEHGGTLEAYARVKRKLVAQQGAGDFAVLNADDGTSRDLAWGLRGRVLWFSRTAPVPEGAWIADGHVWARQTADDEPVDLGPHDVACLPGEHNRENVVAASLAAWLAGADAAAVQRGLRSFRGLRHRIQLVWGSGGVDYYDDLNATTPQATEAALRAIDGPIVLIAGGDDKGLDFGSLGDVIAARVRRLVLLPGAGSDRLAAAVRLAGGGHGRPAIERFADFRDAVAHVVSLAEAGDRVLLSPACPYFFRMHYLDGDEELGFRALLRELTADRGAMAVDRVTERSHEP